MWRFNPKRPRPNGVTHNAADSTRRDGDMIRKTIILGAVMVITASCTHAVPYDPCGDYWYGYIGADMTTADPGADSGQAAYQDDTLTFDYTDRNGDHYTHSLSVTDTSFDDDWWCHLTGSWDGGPQDTSILAVNNNMIISLNREPDGDNDIGISPLLRKAGGVTEADIIGESAYFGHWLGADSRFSWVNAGTIRMNADHTYSITAQDSDGSTSTQTGTWSLNASEAILNVTSDADNSTVQVGLGAGDMAMRFDNDPDDDQDVGFSFTLKKGSGRTESQAVGTYLSQNFYVDSNGENPWTQWGVLDVRDDNTFSFSIEEYDGDRDPDAYTITGTWSMDAEGKLTAVEDGTGNIHECYLSSDASLLVHSAPLSDDHGIQFMVRPPAPDPGDVNWDDIVDADDLSILLQNFEQPYSSWELGDLVDDDYIDSDDLASLLQNWGNTYANPEPTSWAILLAGVWPLLSVRRKRGA